MNTAELAAKDIERCVDLVDKVAMVSESSDSNLKEVLLWVKCHQTSSHDTEKSLKKGSVCRSMRLHCCLNLKTLKLPQLSAISTVFSSQPAKPSLL